MKDIEKAIEELEDRRGYYIDDKCRLTYYDLAISALENQLNNGWIPVSERLPESQPSCIKGTTYIVTLDKPKRTSLAKYKEGKWLGDFGRVIPHEDIIAWHPPLQPYKVGE